MMSFSKMYNLKLITEDHLDPRIVEIGKKIASLLGLHFDGLQEGGKEIYGYDLLQFTDVKDTGSSFYVHLKDTLKDTLDHAIEKLNKMRMKFKEAEVEEPELEPELA